jgi:hypothetical protein
MTKKIWVSIMLFGASFFSVGLPLRGQPREILNLCESSNISLSLPAGLPDGIVSPVYFASTRLKSSSGGMTFHNYLKRKIVGLEFLVDYFDQDRNPLAQVPYIAFSRNQKLHGELHSGLTKHLKNGLPPNKALYIIGESFTLVNTCPTGANLTFLQVFFDDGETEQWKMSNWKTEPLIQQIPTTVQFSCDSENLTSDQYLRARINSDGKISSIEPVAAHHWACLENLRKTLQSWSFYPALQSGKPSDSGLDILVRFDREGRNKKEIYGRVSPEEIMGPTVVIDFVQAQTNPAEWVVIYGPQPFGLT